MLYSLGHLPLKKTAFKGISIDYPYLTDEATEELEFVVTHPEEVTKVRIKISQTPKLVALIIIGVPLEYCHQGECIKV